MRLELQQVEFRNFFCFGNKWQKIPFKNGINLITGFDSNSQKSNGAGKSSLIESIIFGLFGETTKDLNKPQIINWKNKKECEVKISFIKGDCSYVIHRGLKPNFIRVFKNEKELDQLSSLPEMQKFIEESILGIDFETFVSIIHYNPTTSKSIFNVQKSQKRNFIEKIFGLEMYSEITDKCNKKISELNLNIERSNKITEVRVNDYSRIVNNIDLLESNIKNDKEEYEQNLKKLNEKKNSISLNEEEFNEYTIKKEKIIELINEKTDRIKDIEAKKSLLTEKTSLLSKNSVEFNLDEYSNTGKKINQLKEEIIDDISEIEQKITALENENENLKEEKNSLTSKNNIFSIEIKNLEKLNSGICPTCSSKIDKSDVQEKIKSITNNIEKNNSELERIASLIEENSGKIQGSKEQIRNNNKLKEQFNSLKIKFVSLSHAKKDYEEYLKIKEELENIQQSIKNISDEINAESSELKKYEKLNSLIDSKLDDFRRAKNELDSVEREIEIQEKLFEEKEKKYKEINEIISSNKKELKEIESTKNEEEKKTKEWKSEIEYYEYIKRICKDENVKQYAISNMVPFLSRQVNSYLSDAGFNFYLKFDNWLNAEVKGPGIRDAGFGNLSSGQQKTTNLAMILAFLDITKMQASIVPDILLLDEILDGAIDSITLAQMFNIIAKKQREDNLKLFIVSHRKEINELGKIDNIYRIEMKDGFSKVSQVEV